MQEAIRGALPQRYSCTAANTLRITASAVQIGDHMTAVVLSLAAYITYVKRSLSVLPSEIHLFSRAQRSFAHAAIMLKIEVPKDELTGMDAKQRAALP
jgi:hypothetical protein